MSVVANVAVNLDATSVVQRLKQIQTSAIGAGDAFKKLTSSAQAVKSAVEASGGGFAKASTVVGVFAAKVKNTENAIRAQIAALRAVQASVQLGGALYQKAAGQIKQYEDALRKANGAADDAGGGINGLKGKIGAFVGGLALAAVAIDTVKNSLNAAFERGQAETRLRALTSAYGETAEATKLAAAASDRFGMTQTEATKSIADVYGRLRPLGFSLKEISGVYDGFNTLSKQASLSTAESASVFTQLSQALGSGTLRGDEFNRMAESMPAILGVVAKELGVSQNALKGMAADGKISADVVVKGLKKVADAGGDLDKFLDPSTRAMNKLAKESENAQVALGNLLKPAAVAVMEGLAKALQFTVKNLKQIAQTAVFFAAFAGTLKLIALGTQAWAVASKALAAGQKAAGVAAAFLQGVINPASLATTALALGVATAASFALGKAMDGAAADAEKIDPAAQKAAKATAQAAEASKKMQEALAAAKAKATELAVEMQTKVVAAAKAASDAIEIQVEQQGAIGSIVGARIGAEQKLNELQKVGLDQAYAMATTAERRKQIALALFQNEVNAAALQYQSAKAAIFIENEKLKLQQQAAVLKGYEIIAEGQLQILQAKSVEEENKKRQALGEALTAQNNVIRAVAAQGAAQQIVNGYQLAAAGNQYKLAVATAGTALNQKLVSDQIGMSAGQANTLTQNMVAARTSTQTMTNISANLSTKMSEASAALQAGTNAAVQNVQVFGTAAYTSAQSQDAWRESVLKGVGAQQQVSAAVQDTTQKVEAANNIRSTSAAKADAEVVKSNAAANKKIAEASGFSVKRLQDNWKSFTTYFTTNVTTPMAKAWDAMIKALPNAMQSAADLVKSVWTTMTESVKGLVRGMLNFIASSINRVIDSINYLIRGYNSIPTNPFKVSELYRIDVPAFAEGGIVDRPTLAMVGEGGEREFIIPESKMAATAANYLSGGGNSAPASGGSTGNAQISITTGPVMQMDSEQYVTLSDLERAMQMTADGVYKSLRTAAGRYAVGTR